MILSKMRLQPFEREKICYSIFTYPTATQNVTTAASTPMLINLILVLIT